MRGTRTRRAPSWDAAFRFSGWANPIDIVPLSAQTEMLDTYDSPNLIQQLGRWHDLKGDLVLGVSGAVSYHRIRPCAADQRYNT
jgi:hypothetical protein